MSGTIAGTVQTEVILTSNGAYADPVTITGAIEVGTAAAALYAVNNWMITNQGSLSAGLGNGIYLKAGGMIKNSASIYGGQEGIFASSGSIAITNSGIIQGGVMGALIVNAQDTLDNLGVISGGSIGVRFTGFGTANSTLTNHGTIEGIGSVGIQLSQASTDNAADGLIQSNSTAVYLDVLSNLVNYGTISGQTGVAVGSNAATIVDVGTIEGLGGTAISFSSAGGLLELLPGTVFEGIVNGGNNAELLFGSSTTTGIIAGMNKELINFGTVEIAPGAHWEFSGTSPINANSLLDNFGTLIETAADSLGIFGKVAGTGLIDIENSTLVVSNGVAAGQTILLDGAQSTLVLNDPSMFSGTIAGFGGSDLIDIGGIGNTGTITNTVHGNVMTLSGAIAPTTLTFSTAPGSLVLTPILGPSGKSYEITAPCFAAGTRILTIQGPKPVEALRPGDQVITMRGSPKPVIWHGRRRIDCRRHPHPDAVWPVRIEADSFGPGLPAHELHVSPDHALYLAGVLIPAKHLINGVSIRQRPVGSVTYHHIELAAHDVVWAEGLPCETYLDCGNRSQFQASGTSISLHADFAPPRWDRKRGYAPLVISGKTLALVRKSLHAGLLRRGFQPQSSSWFAVEADGQGLPPAAQAGNWYRFAIPPRTTTLILRSLPGVPAETDPGSQDRRRLGIAVTGISIDNTMPSADDSRFGAGFYPAEYSQTALNKLARKPGGKSWFRWTDGEARLEASGMTTLEFTVKGRQPVWRQVDEPPLPQASSASRSRSPA